MSKTNAQRQADYRTRHLKDLDGTSSRLNIIISVQAKAALERLATASGVTQRLFLERVLAEAERATLAGLTTDRELRSYYAKDGPKTVTA